MVKSHFLGTAATALCLAVLASEHAHAQGLPEEPVDLGTLVLGLENLGTTIDEAPGSTSVIDGVDVEDPSNSDVLEAIDTVPNVLTDTAAGGQLPVVRGLDGQAGLVRGTTFTAGSNPRVNFSVDGVTRPATSGGVITAQGSTWDVSRVEVGRGPQTVQSGRSSLAGAINVVTNDPTYELERALRFGFETREGEVVYSAAGLLNIPIVENQLAFRLAVDGDYGDNFINIIDPSVDANTREDVEDIERGNLRAKLLWEPDAIPGLTVIGAYERQVIESLYDNRVEIGTDFAVTNFPAITGEQRSETDVLSFGAAYEIAPGWTLEGRVAHVETDYFLLPSNTTFDVEQTIEDRQAELSLRYEGTGLVTAAVLGFSYENLDEKGFNDTRGTSSPFGFLLDIDGEVRNRSIFGEIEIAPTEQLALYAGGRLENNVVKRTVLGDFGFGPVSGSLDVDDTNFSPRVGARYQLSDVATVGYQYSEGYRPGSVTVSFGNLAAPVAFDGETLKQHEAWLRLNDPGGRFDLTTTAFYYELEDAQTIGAGPGGLIGNVPEAEGFGLEFEGNYRVSDRFQIFGSLGLLETEITNAGNGPNAGDLAGQELPGTANVAASLGFAYFAKSGWDFGGQIRHVSGQDVPVVFGDTSLPTPAYTVVDIKAGYDFSVGTTDMRLEAFVQNLFDEDIILSRNVGLGGAPDFEVVGAPRTIGLALTARF
ncbi:MAG: TonB-dependent receptor [Pseudomonadota bacterium]